MINKEPVIGSEYTPASFSLSPSCQLIRCEAANRREPWGTAENCGVRSDETNRPSKRDLSSNHRASFVNPFSRLDATAPSGAPALIPPIKGSRAKSRPFSHYIFKSRSILSIPVDDHLASTFHPSTCSAYYSTYYFSALFFCASSEIP